MFKLPLMNDNIDKEDIKSVVEFLLGDSIPKLTNGPRAVESIEKMLLVKLER